MKDQLSREGSQIEFWKALLLLGVFGGFTMLASGCLLIGLLLLVL